MNLFMMGAFGVMAGCGVIFFVWIMGFKHKFRVRQITGTKTFIVDDKARVYKDKDGVTYWRLLKFRDIIPMPPSDAIDVTSKGKFVVEAYRNEQGEYQYIYDHKAMAVFQPLTTNQRLILINQIKKANAKRKTEWMQYAPLIASGMVLVIIMVMAFTFWDDITKPAVGAANSNAQASKDMRDAVTRLDNILQKKQMIGELPDEDSPPN